MISGHAQFAITAEIVPQMDKEVKQNISECGALGLAAVSLSQADLFHKFLIVPEK